MFYNNEKLNEIYRDTWPNLGWAKKDMENKFAGNYPGPLYAQHPDLVMTHEEMLEEAAKREEENVIHAKVSEEDYLKVLNAPKEKAALAAVDKLYKENGDDLKQLAEIEAAERERPFYRFFAIEYFATGEGMSFWLKVCRNYDLYNNIDYDLERFVKFIGEGADHYIHGLTQPTQEEFMTQYANLIPAHVVKMIERKDQPALDWETHFHVNYS